MLLRLLLTVVALGGVLAAPYTVDDAIAVFQRAQDQVVATWRYQPDIVCARSRLCGSVTKNASGSALARFYTRTTSTDESWPEVAAGMPLFSGFQVYVSEIYK